ncbi:hypothetical protein C2G38_121846 [Gigaspora rosea]|uniref:Transmembrane protein n=1 Tax=Gigaspora rosea TaxID=44941 RepID=A0A397ULZ6_9GLOM|nr:hypothetical protein C2G38_121846 [Gigaspora rosea]
MHVENRRSRIFYDNRSFNLFFFLTYSFLIYPRYVLIVAGVTGFGVVVLLELCCKLVAFGVVVFDVAV